MNFILLARTMETFWYGLGVEEDGTGVGSTEGRDSGAGSGVEWALRARRATILSWTY